MSSVTRPRGPLPARVYWTRRVLLAVVALGLVVGIEHLLGGGSGANGPSARPVGADVSASPSSRPTTPQASPTKHARTGSPTPTPLAVPTGSCPDSDVVVTPAVHGIPYAGRPVIFDLQLTTSQSPACTWTVSKRTLVVRLTSGTDRIWSTQDCPDAISPQQVVVRRDVPTAISVKWRGQRSDGTCSDTNPWALPGYYHVTAAAIGAEPDEQQFKLLAPVAPTITPSPSPSPSPSGSASASPSGTPSKR